MTPLPCPFCGSPAIRGTTIYGPKCRFYCGECGNADQKGSDAWDDAIAKWNVRVFPTLRSRGKPPESGPALCLYTDGETRWWKQDCFIGSGWGWGSEVDEIRVVGWLPLPPTDLEVQG